MARQPRWNAVEELELSDEEDEAVPEKKPAAAADVVKDRLTSRLVGSLFAGNDEEVQGFVAGLYFIEQEEKKKAEEAKKRGNAEISGGATSAVGPPLKKLAVQAPADINTAAIPRPVSPPSPPPAPPIPKRPSAPAVKKAPLTFNQKEKRKRDLGQCSRAKNWVEEEKRVLRHSGM
eukprot:gnl/Hemi2/3792_TR1334_c0_g1_i1.p1 gnl/Hemi2/3792_TR1334_c0_g1~~gnl/Hemi2/3792_TR1334_c0_g1_i1.p1  ORF type:complete len:189 (+),score=56.07 gnl/Hemi2/3792_TR1334_c0_g1_i1:41-568(+)